MPRFTPLNNPLTWLLGLAAAAVLALLLANALLTNPAYAGMPDNVIVARDADSVTVIAAEVFAAGPAHRFLLGRMYRDAWATPVRAPVLRLDTFRGGLAPEDPGGGFQTLSLDLVDTAGQVYTLRSVAKDPAELVPGFAPYLGIVNVVTDGISAGHPYGALAAAALAEAAGLRHMHPQLAYVPSQAALDTFDDRYGDRLYWLEYEPEGDVAPWLDLPGFHDFDDSEDVLADWRADPARHRPDLRTLARARLFDVWVGDWDRHDGQWGWADCHSGDAHFYVPIANDRDNVFYGLSGIIPTLVSTFERRLVPFAADAVDVGGLMANSIAFDTAFLGGVPLDTFLAEAEELQRLLTDDAIAEALRSAWPPQIYALDGERIRRRLVRRRGELDRYAREFFEELRDAPSAS